MLTAADQAKLPDLRLSSATGANVKPDYSAERKYLPLIDLSHLAASTVDVRIPHELTVLSIISIFRVFL